MKKSTKLKYFSLVGMAITLGLSVYSLFTEGVDNRLSFLFVFFFGVCTALFYSAYFRSQAEKRVVWLEERLKLWNSISYRVKTAGEKSFTDMPIGIIIYSNRQVIEWANNYAKDMFLSPLIERQISNINKELSEKMQVKNEFDIVLYGKEFHCTILKNDNIMFLSDKTDYRLLEKKYFDRTNVAGIINLDNLDQAMTTLDAQERSMILSNIIGILSEWCNKFNIYLRGYSEEQYIILFDRKTLAEVLTDKFKVLDYVREYCTKVDLRITASVGIASSDVGIIELMEIAKSQLDLALNRGGNQAVINIDGETSYYGGTTTGVENRSPVYVRVKSEDLKNLILNARNVIIMPHSDVDSDGFGASIAMAKLVKSLEKKAVIVFDQAHADQTIKNIFEEIQKEHLNLLDLFIDPKEALNILSDDTLLIILDTQYENLLMDVKIYKKAKNIAILDHHRRSGSAISDYLFLYNQSSSSSTVEMIVEMFEYFGTEIEISPIEASFMLLGIVVDTSNLMFRTSYRTFNVMSKLQTLGAEMPKVQRFLREDFGEYSEKMAILNTMQMVKGKYAIVTCNEEKIYTRQFIAKITDSMIGISDVKASFCVGRIDSDLIGISARSLDEENVQVIMEKLDGGGHFNNAATQIKGITVEQAKERLVFELENIDNGGDDSMKIILIKDVKGKGKNGEIIDIPSGHANYLIRSKLAVMATVDNIKQLEKQTNALKEEAEKQLEDMKFLKDFIEHNPITIGVRVGKEGKLFGCVSTKQIVDEYKKKYDVTLDKRKIIYDKEINCLGTYSIPIQLHKEVVANITLYVVEKA